MAKFFFGGGEGVVDGWVEVFITFLKCSHFCELCVFSLALAGKVCIKFSKLQHKIMQINEKTNYSCVGIMPDAAGTLCIVLGQNYACIIHQTI